MDDIAKANVTSPEAWPEAIAVREKRTIKTVRGPAQFDVRAVSHDEYTAIGKEYTDPKPPEVKRKGRVETDPNDPKYQDECRIIELRRQVATVDLCWQTIPGETMAAKEAMVLEHLYRGGELLRLYQEIMTLSGFGGNEAESNDTEPVLVATPAEWLEAAKAPTRYTFTRAGQALAFAVKGISGSKRKQIEVATDAGAPPIDFAEMPGSRRGAPMPNPEAPAYKRKTEECSKARMVMLLEAALPFEVPGKTVSDKLEWLGKRPAGEVLMLLAFINTDGMAFRGAVDFS